MKDKITSIRLSQDTKNKLQNIKKYPRETDEEVLIRLIKNNINSQIDCKEVKK